MQWFSYPQVTESKPPQQEDMFESVYENFWVMDKSVCTPQEMCFRDGWCVIEIQCKNIACVLST